MPTAITPVPQWVPALTNAGADIPNSANMLAVLQTHADRQEFTFLRNALQLRMLATADPATILGVGVHERAGQIVLIGSSNFARVGLAYPGATSGSGTGEGLRYQEGVAIAGTPSLIGLVNSAYNGTGALVFVSAGYSYVYTAQADTGARYAFDALTTARDIIWSPHYGKFIAVGATSAASRIESSTGGVTWATETYAADPTLGWDRIAGDATGQYLLVVGGGNDRWAYSADGGDTWTAFQKTIGGDSSYNVTGLAYDDSRGIWLATLDSTFSGDKTRVWTVDDPVSGTWAVSGASIPIYGLGGADYMTYARSIVTCGSSWIVGAEGSVSGLCNVWVTRDAGATWEWPVGYGASISSPINLRRCGSYLALGNSTYFEAISGRLWT